MATLARSTTKAAAPPAPAAFVWFALAIVYVVWGSTYLAIRVVVETTPPLLAMGARFLTAGAILALILAIRHGPGRLRVSRREAGAAGLVGALLLLGGNGAVAIAEQTVPSGLAALLIAATPFFLVCLRTAAGDRPRTMSVVGTLVGFLGVGLLLQPRQGSGDIATDIRVWGLLLLIFAAFSWAVGSFLSSRLPLPANPFVATAWEMVLGGSALFICGVLRGELRGFALSQVPGEAWAWLVYLVLFGSLAAFTAYIWLLSHAPISLTATYAYVNPVVAVLLGAVVLAEPVTLPIIVGGAIVVAGVGLVVSTERPRARTGDRTTT
jgi:drug/metabolite transporter (DMT)-like permease